MSTRAARARARKAEGGVLAWARVFPVLSPYQAMPATMPRASRAPSSPAHLLVGVREGQVALVGGGVLQDSAGST